MKFRQYGTEKLLQQKQSFDMMPITTVTLSRAVINNNNTNNNIINERPPFL